MQVLVTGANGHVGSHLSRALLSRGMRVVAMVRATSDLRALAGLDVELRHGDVRDRDSFVAAASGCTVIYHTAAVYRTWTRDPDEVMAPAIEGTDNVFAAAVAAGAKRIVLTSSIAAVGSSADPARSLTERDWNADPSNVYLRAKTESERRAHTLARETGIELVVVCPAMVIGSLDYRITPSTELIRDLVNGTKPAWRGGLNFVSVDDVAELHALAGMHGSPGERYLAVGENVSLQEIAFQIEQLTGRWVMRVELPRGLVLWAAWLLTHVARWTGRTPLVDHETARDVVGRYHYYDDRWTRERLRFQPRSFARALQDAIAWLNRMGLVRPQGSWLQRLTAIRRPRSAGRLEAS